MAEYCFKCFKENFEYNGPPQDIVFSHYKTLCEACEKEKHVVIAVRSAGPIKRILFKLGFFKNKF